MYDDSINHHTPPAEPAELNSALDAELKAALDERIVQALENLPEISIPAGFAARLASQVPARPTVSPRVTHYGKATMLLSMVALLITLLALAGERHATSTLNLALQWTLFAQFLGLLIWLSTRRHRTD